MSTRAGNVAAFGCGTPHPSLGEPAACTRQRHHPGDHRATVDVRMYTWPDPATVPPPPTYTDGGVSGAQRLAEWRAQLQPPYPDGTPYEQPAVPSVDVSPQALESRHLTVTHNLEHTALVALGLVALICALLLAALEVLLG